jgi:hypothetical protein
MAGVIVEAKSPAIVAIAIIAVVAYVFERLFFIYPLTHMCTIRGLFAKNHLLLLNVWRLASNCLRHVIYHDGARLPRISQ